MNDGQAKQALLPCNRVPPLGQELKISSLLAA